MRIAILGTGTVGQTIGTKLVQIGHEVFMGSREAANPKAVAWANKENLHKDSTQKHALFGTFANAAAFGEVIFNCTLGVASLEAVFLNWGSAARGRPSRRDSPTTICVSGSWRAAASRRRAPWCSSSWMCPAG